jgi:carbonic anhydrase
MNNLLLIKNIKICVFKFSIKLILYKMHKLKLLFLPLYLAYFSLNQPLDYSESDWDPICKTGLKQSPIDFGRNINYHPAEGYIKLISQHYNQLEGIPLQIRGGKSFAFDISDHGYVILFKNGVMYRYELIDVHLHIGSEHTINGKRYDLEVHLYHVKNREHLLTSPVIDPHDETNDLLVIGLLFDSSYDKPSSILDKFNLNDRSPVDINLHELYTTKEGFYHYVGSTTTPPCGENINWMVMDTIRPMSKEQLRLLKEWTGLIYPKGNARRVKKLNGRTVWRIYDSSLPDSWGDVFYGISPYTWGMLGVGFALGFSILGAAWYIDFNR